MRKHLHVCEAAVTVMWSGTELQDGLHPAARMWRIHQDLRTDSAAAGLSHARLEPTRKQARCMHHTTGNKQL